MFEGCLNQAWYFLYILGSAILFYPFVLFTFYPFAPFVPCGQPWPSLRPSCQSLWPGPPEPRLGQAAACGYVSPPVPGSRGTPSNLHDVQVGIGPPCYPGDTDQVPWNGWPRHGRARPMQCQPAQDRPGQGLECFGFNRSNRSNRSARSTRSNRSNRLGGRRFPQRGPARASRPPFDGNSFCNLTADFYPQGGRQHAAKPLKFLWPNPKPSTPSTPNPLL